MTSRPNRKCASPTRMESLESRLMFHLEPAAPLGNTFANPGGPATTVDLSGAFDNEEIDGTIVRLATTSGNIDLELFDTPAPRNVANYLNYVNSGRYNGTIIHRSVPGFVIQGGGFTPNGQHIEQFAPVRNEFSSTRSNVRGTVAMAKIPGFQDFNGNGVQDAGEPSIPGGGPDSATSEFFVNLADNGGTAPNGLDFQNGGFTVFGRVINNGMSTAVDPIAALPTENASELAGAFTNLPVRADIPDAQTPTADDMVLVNTASVVPEAGIYTYTATSSDPALVTPTVNGTNLTLAYGPGTGTATITVTATAADGTTASQTFQAGVGELNLTLSGERGQPNAVTFTDADGTRGRITIARAGLATLRLTGTDLTQNTRGRNVFAGGTVSTVSPITATDTTQDTTITVRGRGGNGLLSTTGLTTQGPLRALNAKSLDVTGDVTIGGTARTVQIGRIAGGTLTVGGTLTDQVPVAITLGSAEDAAVTSGSNVRSLKTGAFTHTGTAQAIAAPSIGALTGTDVFNGNVNVAGRIGSARVAGNFQGDVSAESVGPVNVRGTMTGSNITLTQSFSPGERALASLNVRGDLINSVVRSTGNIGSVSVGSLTNSRVFAGINDALTSLPTAAGDFVAAAQVSSVRVRGNVVNSNVAASRLNNVTLGTVVTDNAGTPFGVAAQGVRTLTGRVAPGEQRFRFRNLEAQADVDAQAAAQGVNLGNFAVRLF